MAMRDTTCVKARNGRARFFTLFSLLFTSMVLFLATYRRYGTVPVNSIFGLHQAPASNSRDVTMMLQPNEHVRRPATTITHHWNITKGYRSPDGVHKLVYLINGMMTSELRLEFSLS
jgi:hypothetical protein